MSNGADLNTPQIRTQVGVVRYPPGATLPIGFELNTNFVRFPAYDTGGIVSIRNWDVFRGVLTAFHFEEGDRHRVTGSGVLVGPGIIIGATHVVEPEAPRMVTREIGGIISAFTSSGMMLWHPQRVVADPSSDIAIITASCATDLPQGNQLSLASMSSRVPAVGELAMIVGFRPRQNEFERSDRLSALTGDVFVSSGRVTQVFPNGRDRAVLPWPVVEVDCPTLGAMSGGPVFNATGHLIGVLATSFESDDSRGPSYVSLLGPALMMRFRPVWPVPAQNDLFFNLRAPHLWELE